MRLCDAHCHFFSSRFLELLTKDLDTFPRTGRADAVAKHLGWDPPGTPEGLADRWVTEMARHGVSRSVLIASVPGDEASVAAAVAKYPQDFVGFFMLNPETVDVIDTVKRALGELKLRAVALFPSMFGNHLGFGRSHDVFQIARAHGAAVFVHCGVLKVGVRQKLGLPHLFDARYSDPQLLHELAPHFRTVPIIIPHFGAGFLREALMVADHAPNIYFDTSSSNSWMKYYPGLTLEAVFRAALSVVGPERLLFGTDSSFFPRGWQKGIYDTQRAALDAIGVSAEDQAKIFGGNFERLFP